ncbi:MAG TPA: hypothetical protein VEV13_00530 [Candidatus Limnocylindria bacterium]|nr:hypothetical protein [Candidatus Limnocylindria bacterium]
MGRGLVAGHGLPRLAVGIATLGLLGLTVQTPASQAATIPDLVGVVPSAATPQVLDDGSGTAQVRAIAEVGKKVVLGGTFTRISDAGGPVRSARNLAVYDATTGLVTLLPVVNGTVSALLPGPKPGTVLVGGSFTAVGSTSVRNLALVNISTGLVSRSFTPPTVDGGVTDLAIVGSHVLVAGRFRTVGGVAQTALVSLSATTGRADHWLSLTFTGHHNWRATNVTDAKAAVGITRMATNPSGSKLVVIGNFTSINRLPRDQMAVIDLAASSPRVSATWATTSLKSACKRIKYDSWVRDVAVSPDGSYAVVTSTGGPYPGTLCDSAARFELNTRSRDVPPTWVAAAGGDTLLSVAIAATAVYVGGHMRWLNNSTGANSAGSGAVPRASLAALDPTSGLPFSWNPGRHPRGYGVTALLLTARGLYVGSDTDYLGNEAYLRPRIALLPLSNGSVLPDLTAPTQPDVYRAGPPDLGGGEIERLHVGATGVDHRWDTPLTTTVDWSQVRGAFTAGNQLWTAMADGSLVRRSFDGVSVGSPEVVEPWADPAWSEQQTGSAVDQTYLGQPSALASLLPTVTSLTYSDGWLFYTTAGSPALNVRAFNPESGIVADRASVVRDVGMPTTISSMFVQGDSAFLADADGSLTRRPLLGQTLGSTSTVVGGPGVDGIDWSQAVLFSGPGPTVP